MSIYPRSKVEAAIWACFTHGRGQVAMPTAFSRRLRKMTELDVPFPKEERMGRGHHAQYELRHAFLLTLALKLQDSGLSQTAAADVVNHMRAKILWCFDRVMANPSGGRMMVPFKDRPNCPKRMPMATAKKEHRHWYADTSVFMSLRYREIVEALTDEPRGPVVFEPMFHVGLEDLAGSLEGMEFSFGGVRIVVEMSGLIFLLDHYLQADA